MIILMLNYNLYYSTVLYNLFIFLKKILSPSSNLQTPEINLQESEIES